MKITGEQIIGYSYSKQGKNSFYGINPVTDKKLQTVFYDATSDEIDMAVRFADKAFRIYKKKTSFEKAKYLDKIADEIMALDDELIHLCIEETALTEDRLISERSRTVNQLKLFAELIREGSWVDARIDTAIADRKPSPKPDIRQMQIPLGPIAIFGSSNFPLAFSVAGGDTASALAAGCTVIVKANPAHPGTSEIVGRAIIKAAYETNMPEGIFSLLQGKSPEVGMNIVNHPLIKAISFTGSYNAGKAIYDAAVKRPEPIPVYAEMGSTNPVFLLPNALKKNSKTIAQELINSFTLGVGQFCTNPGIVIIIKSKESDEFTNILKEKLSNVPPGTMLTKKIKETFEKGIDRLSKINDVHIIAKGKESKNHNESTAYVLQSNVKTLMKNPQLAMEVFGPSTVIINAENENELLKLAKNLKGHLTSSIICTSDDLQKYYELIEILKDKVGRLIINGFPTGVEVCHSMHHGGPFPATTNISFTSVGTASIKRFVRPLCFQNFPQLLLPDELKNKNPLNIWRLVNDKFTKDKI